MKKQPAGSKKTSRFSSGSPIILLATALLVALAVLLVSAGTVTAAPAPTVTGISPDNGRQGQWVEGVQISGTDFGTDQSNVSIRLKNGLDTINGNVWNVSDTSINGEFHIPANVTLGAWDVVVEHNDDHLTGTLSSGFTVNVGASISGMVTHDGSGVPNILVAAISSGGGGDSQSTQSTTDGSYTIGGLSPGTRYKVVFWDQSGTYAFEYYNDKGTWASAADVPAPSTDINEDLEDGVTITGTVTDAVTHDPIPNCYVAWSDSTSDLSPSSVPTGPDGTYTLRGLKSGVGYKVSFNINIPGGSLPLPYTPQWYNNKFNWAEAGIVTAAAANIDAQLDTTPSGTISGTVSSAGGPLNNIYVIALLSSSGAQASMAATAPDGTYTINSLTPGTNYKIIFYDESSQYAVEFYDGAGTWGTAMDVGGGATDINAVMEDAVTITGTVRDAITHDPIPYCEVAWADATLPDLYPPSVQTDVNGVYALPGLKSGVGYKVSFTPSAPHYAQWYNGQPDWTHANLAPGGSSGIDANLYSESAPSVSSIDPDNYPNIGTVLGATVSGSDFVDGATVKLTMTGQPDIDATNVAFQDSHTITCDIPVLEKKAGDWNVVVINPDGQEGQLDDGFQVTNPTPTINSITPNHGVNTGTVSITNLAGSYFREGATVDLVSGHTDIPATNVAVASSNQITCIFDLTGAALGRWDVVVTNAGPGGGSRTLSQGFEVTGSAPTVTGVSPGEGQAGDTFQITISGTGFQNGAVARLERTGQTSIDLGVSYVNPNMLSNPSFTLPYNTLYGNWNVVVENPDHQQATAPVPFNVTWHSPSVSTIDPHVGNRDSIVHATVNGQYFRTGAQVSFATSGAHIDATNEAVDPSGTFIACDLDLTGANLGPWNVIVTNNDGHYGFILNGFTVEWPPPVVEGASPNPIYNFAANHVVIDGHDFRTGCEVKMTKSTESDIAATNVLVNGGGTQITCDFINPDGLAATDWNLEVSNNDAKTSFFPNFGLWNPAPNADDNVPITGANNNPALVLTINGNSFARNATVRLLKNGQAPIIANVNVPGANQLITIANINGAAVGQWDVDVINPQPGGGTSTIIGGLRINYPNPPNPTNITPNSGINVRSYDVTIDGTGFQTGACTVQLTRTGETPIDADVAVSPTQITGNFDLTGAATGQWNVVVKNDDDQTGTITNGFTVYPQYDVNASVTGGHGTALPATQKIDHGSNATINIAPEAHYHIASITDNGHPVAISNPYVIDNVVANHNVAVTFKQTPVSTSKWYLAEGSTKWGFDTYISILNPNHTAVNATLHFFTSSSTPLIKNVTLPGNSQTSLNARDYVGNADFSTEVEAEGNKPIAVDRTMMWTGQGSAAPEAHSSVGVTAPDTTWYLAEGSTDWNFECWLLIQNPGNQDAKCDVTYMTETGPQKVTKVVPANSRQTFNVANDIGVKDTSIKVESDVPVIAERSMYRYNRREGAESIGTTAPSNDFYLAEGSTDWGFQTWVLVENPNNANNSVTVEFSNGITSSFTMAPETRKTVNVNSLAPKADVATHVHGTLPIVAERTMYWNSYAGEACHDSIGLAAPHRSFSLPDGAVLNGWETWTLIQNPNDKQVTVNVTYLARDGSKAPVTFREVLPAKSRKTLNMADKVGYNCGVKVTCSDPIMVERSMYGYNRATGTNTIGGFSD